MTDFLPSECDIVMEGGVTSGVVYPTFVASLARRFTLRSIGGTSVGAVAAVAAAAAQFRRNRAGTMDGFAKLSGIPDELQKNVSGKSLLFTLFQPCADLARHFSVIGAALNRRHWALAFLHASLILVTRFWLGAAAGLVVGMVGLYISRSLFGMVWYTWISLPSLLWFGVAVLGTAWLGAIGEFCYTLFTGLSKNRCGICSGLRDGRDGQPALTDWLHALIQNIGGLPSKEPLTFGDLKSSEPPIELALMTTGLSELRAHRLPHTSRDLVFRASEFRELFPSDVVDWMIAKSGAVSHSEETHALLVAADQGGERNHYYLPHADQLPIVVAARMSLSFPLLLQAVPMFRIRESDESTSTAALRRVWFSDGGLTSNFPIHFFDALLPTRPTFGVTLLNDFDPARPDTERVVLPHVNNDGVRPSYNSIEGDDSLPSPFAFAGAILRTIRTWRDEALKRTPGYRDRVVQIHHTKGEGGLNLNMPADSINRMRDSGTLAADQIIARFLCEDPARNGWLNHRWVRMRSAAAVLQNEIKPMHDAMASTRLAPSYEDLWLGNGAMAQGAYPLNEKNRAAGHALWMNLMGVEALLQGADLSASAPRPEPTLDISPKQN